MNTWLQGLFSPLSFTYTQKERERKGILRLQSAQNHMCFSQSGWMQWKLVVFHGDYYSLQIVLCESSPYVFAHKIPPASWRPPGHNQSGPGVKIILSLVQRQTLVEGLTRQEGELNQTWCSTHDRDGEYTSFPTRQALCYLLNVVALVAAL